MKCTYPNVLLTGATLDASPKGVSLYLMLELWTVELSRVANEKLQLETRCCLKKVQRSRREV
jgi:hypothetical protein